MANARTITLAFSIFSLWFGFSVANAAQLKMIATGTITLAQDEIGFGLSDGIEIGDQFVVEVSHNDEAAGVQRSLWTKDYEEAVDSVRITVGTFVFDLSLPAHGYDRRIRVRNNEPHPLGYFDSVGVTVVKQGGIIAAPFSLGVGFLSDQEEPPKALSDLTLPSGALPYALFDSGGFGWTEIEDGVMPGPLSPDPRVERFGGDIEFVRYINDGVAGAVVEVGSRTLVPIPAAFILFVPCVALLFSNRVRIKRF